MGAPRRTVKTGLGPATDRGCTNYRRQLRRPRYCRGDPGKIAHPWRRPEPMPDDLPVDQLKLPPHSVEAEQSVLGGLLLDNEAADRIGDVVSAEDFYSEAHRLLYRHTTQLIAE